MRPLSETRQRQAMTALPPPVDIRGADDDAVPVVFTSPHSGSFYPDEMCARMQVPLEDLRRTEDAYVDELFRAAADAGSVLVTTAFARGYVDLNRDTRELDPMMFADGPPRTCGLPSARVKAGLGCVPRIAASGLDIYAGPLETDDGAFRLSHVHDSFHAALARQLDQRKARWRDIVLVDCHSMPSVQPGRPGLPDIVLGDRFGSSCSARLTSLVEQTLRRSGLRVVRNAPYAGGYITRRYGRPRRGVHALQIEINRGLYLHEHSVEKSAGFTRIQTIMTDLAEEIIAFARRLNG